MPARPPALAFALLAGGCATAPPPPAEGPTGGAGDREPVRIVMDPIRIEVRRRDGGSEVVVTEPGPLFDEAGLLLDARELGAALRRYQALLRDFPDCRFVPAALYNAGLAHEGLGEFAQAAARYRELADRFPDTRDGLDGLFRLGAVLAESGDWQGSIDVYRRALARPDLTAADAIEAGARLGHAQLQAGDLDGAEGTLAGAIDREQAHPAAPAEGRFFPAMARFTLASVPHARLSAMQVRLPEEQMEKDLEEMARLLLLAQERYLETIRERDPHWATAAGHEIGALYARFHGALLEAPIPPELDAEAGAVYREELRKAVRPLVEKAVRVFEKTLLMAERTGVRNEWVERSRGDLEAMRRLLLSDVDAGSTPAEPARPADWPSLQL